MIGNIVDYITYLINSLGKKHTNFIVKLNKDQKKKNIFKFLSKFDKKNDLVKHIEEKVDLDHITPAIHATAHKIRRHYESQGNHDSGDSWMHGISEKLQHVGESLSKPKHDFSHSKKLMTEHDIAMADLLKAAYSDNRPRKYDDFNYDRELSNKDITVYNRNGETVVAISGTKIHSPSDWASNAKIWLDSSKFKYPRFEDALNTTIAAKKKYTNDSLTVTGHSLGSNVALETASKLPQSVDRTVHFNGYHAHDHHSQMVAYNKHRFLVTSGDPIGVYGASKLKPRNLTYFHRGMSTDVKKNHSIDNFISKNVMDVDRLQAHRDLEKHDEIAFNDKEYPEKNNKDFVEPKPQETVLSKHKIFNPMKQSQKLGE